MLLDNQFFFSRKIELGIEIGILSNKLILKEAAIKCLIALVEADENEITIDRSKLIQLAIKEGVTGGVELAIVCYRKVISNKFIFLTSCLTDLISDKMSQDFQKEAYLKGLI